MSSFDEMKILQKEADLANYRRLKMPGRQPQTPA